MKPETLNWIGIAASIIVLAIVWVVVIGVALHVSSIVLDTLEQIVDLAAISPD
jgi:hypothetical protein